MLNGAPMKLKIAVARPLSSLKMATDIVTHQVPASIIIAHMKKQSYTCRHGQQVWCDQFIEHSHLRATFLVNKYGDGHPGWYLRSWHQLHLLWHHRRPLRDTRNKIGHSYTTTMTPSKAASTSPCRAGTTTTADTNLTALKPAPAPTYPSLTPSESTS